MKHIVSYSGGKDSSAMLIKMIEQNTENGKRFNRGSRCASHLADHGSDYNILEQNDTDEMNKAVALMLDDGFENADIVFITDGECALPEGCAAQLKKYQEERRFTVTGILLDKGSPGMDFSLKAFCQNIYRTSELMGDEIVRELVNARV